MKTLSVNIPERLIAVGVFNNPENKVATSDLKVYLEDASKFRLTQEDKEAVKWEDIKDEAGVIVSVKWDEAGVEPKSIEIDDFTANFLKEKLSATEVSAAEPLALHYSSLLEKLQ